MNQLGLFTTPYDSLPAPLRALHGTLWCVFETEVCRADWLNSYMRTCLPDVDASFAVEQLIAVGALERVEFEGQDGFRVKEMG